jgi:hypothetical protein
VLARRRAQDAERARRHRASRKNASRRIIDIDTVTEFSVTLVPRTPDGICAKSTSSMPALAGRRRAEPSFLSLFRSPARTESKKVPPTAAPSGALNLHVYPRHLVMERGNEHCESGSDRHVPGDQLRQEKIAKRLYFLEKSCINRRRIQ